jgi:hypothetical protein
MADYSEQDAPWYFYRFLIETVVVADGVTNIGDYAFDGCDFASITIPNSVTSIGSGAFSQCHGLTSITLPESVTTVGDYAFMDCEWLTSITIPNSVTSIGSGAFSQCRGLTEINVSGTNYHLAENVGAGQVWIPYSDEGLNSDCSNVVGSLAIGDLTLPDSVTSIGYHAFAGCNITSITIPNTVTSIGERAFFNCLNLSSVTIPESVTSIGEYAFGGGFWYSYVTSVTNRSSVPQTISGTVFTCLWSITLYVPTGSLSAYQNAEVWKDFNNIVETSTFTTPSDNYATIEWVAVDNAAGYNISVYSDAEHTQLVGSAYVPASNAQPAPAKSPLRSSTAGNILQYTIEGLSENTPYFFEIVAVDATNEPIVTFDGNFTTKQSTGIDAVLAGEIRIYPNPAKDVLHINLLGFENLTGLNAQIYDISGRVLSPTPLQIGEEQGVRINVSHLPSGVYFLKIGDKQGKFVKK